MVVEWPFLEVALPPPTCPSDWNWHGTLCRSKRGLLRSKVLLLPQLALDDKGGMMVLSAAQTTWVTLGVTEALVVRGCFRGSDGFAKFCERVASFFSAPLLRHLCDTW